MQQHSLKRSCAIVRTRQQIREYKRFVPQLPTYDEIVKQFRWRIPDHYNIGVDICDKHANNSLTRNNPAIIFDENDGKGSVQTITYERMKMLTDQLANALQFKLGMLPGYRIAILLPQSLETALSHVAIYKCASIAVPLFVLFGPDALQYRLDNSGSVTVITGEEGLEKIVQIKESLPQLKHIVLVRQAAGKHGALPAVPGAIVHDFWELLQGGSPHHTPVETKAEDPAVVIYTSGTTGPPKGCLHAHRVLLGHMPGVEFPHNFFPQEKDLFWTPADWAWVGGLFDVLLSGMHHGIPVLAHRAKKFDPEEAFFLMQKHNVRNVFMPPTALKLMKHVENPKMRYQYALRSIGSGGESLGQSTLEWGKNTFGIDINEFYGQTEMNLIVGNCAQVMPVKPGSMGRAIPGHQVEVVDEEGNILPPGKVGVVAAKPDPVTFLRYLNNPDATKKKFTSQGWLKTGDMAQKDEEGYFFFVGRDDDIIKSSAYRIGPSEIEECLMKLPGVSVCAAVGTPDELRGEVVKAFIVLKPEYKERARHQSADLVKEIQAHVKNHLAAYEYPRHIEFVDELPMTTTGKIQRKVLRDREYEKLNKKKFDNKQ